jgi:hypothetical protein
VFDHRPEREHDLHVRCIRGERGGPMTFLSYIAAMAMGYGIARAVDHWKTTK